MGDAVNATELLIIALATYRVATDLAWEDGPLELFARFRGLMIERFGASSWIAEGVQCPICLSFWAALACLGLALAGVWLPLYWLAVAGAVALGVRK